MTRIVTGEKEEVVKVRVSEGMEALQATCQMALSSGVLAFIVKSAVSLLAFVVSKGVVASEFSSILLG